MSPEAQILVGSVQEYPIPAPTDLHVFHNAQGSRRASQSPTRRRTQSYCQSRPTLPPQQLRAHPSLMPSTRWQSSVHLGSLNLFGGTVVQRTESRCSCLYISSALVSTSVAHGTMRLDFPGLHLT